MESLYRYLDTVGDGSGNKNFNGNYSVAEEEAILAPAANEIFRVTRMIISLQDTSGMSAVDYGNKTNGLISGLQLRKDDGSIVLADITDGVPIKSNAQWGSLCYDSTVKTWSQGDEVLLVRFTFDKAGQPIILHGANNNRLVATLNDDFSGFVFQRFNAQGTVETI